MGSVPELHGVVFGKPIEASDLDYYSHCIHEYNIKMKMEMSRKK